MAFTSYGFCWLSEVEASITHNNPERDQILFVASYTKLQSKVPPVIASEA
ncbi:MULTISPECIES: hypothetical protein [Brasilonema]|nr:MULTISPECIES: hypothetical protein [Brasilonema]